MGLVNAVGSNNLSVMDMLTADKKKGRKETLKETFSQLVQDKNAEYFTRIQSGSFEQSFQIGAGSYTETEWKKLLKYFDLAEEQLREAAEETKKVVQKTAVSASDEDDETKEKEAEMLLAEITSCTYQMKDGEELSYFTFYEKDRIYCKKEGKEDCEWEILLEDESQYDRIMSFLNTLEDKENLSFTIHNTFWQDFLSGELNVDEFQEFLGTLTKEEISNGLKITEDGVFEKETMKYASYIYGPEFGANMMRTTEEFLKWQEKQMDKILGIGFLNAPTGNISYGMRAEYAENSTSDSPIIKVTIQKGHSEEVHYINVNQVNARNATEIEMFALCCYADDTGKGTGGKFGTWQTLNYYRTNASDNGKFNLTKSMDSYLSVRQNWLLMIEQMRNLYIKSGLYQQSLDGNLLLQSLT